MIKAKRLIQNAEKVVFFTGAGISTGSGLPTFRGWFGIYSWPWTVFACVCVISLIASIVSVRLSQALFGLGVLLTGVILFLTWTTLYGHGWRYVTEENFVRRAKVIRIFVIFVKR
jgi:hypothetical protein